MKKYYWIIVMGLALLACQKKEPYSLEVTPNALEFTAEGGTKTFDVVSNGEWTLETDGQQWYQLSAFEAKGKQTISVTVAPYIQAAGRSAQLTVKGEGIVLNVALVQVRPAVPENPDNSSVSFRAYEQDYAFDVPSGYEVKVTAEGDFLSVSQQDGQWSAHLQANQTDAVREGKILVTTTDDKPLSTIALTQSWRNVEPGELLIEEVFFTGVLPEGATTGDASSGDQYLKITNNTDETLYADGLLFAHSYIVNEAGSWVYPTLTDEIPVDTIYQIPGSGIDVPVAPGASIVIAVAAQDFSGNGGIDLSKADYEFFDGTEANDTDNPDVADLALWFKASKTVTMFQSQGNKSMAIAVLPHAYSPESFMAEFVWEGKREFWMNGGKISEKDITGAYLINNEWVIDGVNMALIEGEVELYFNEGVDAGYTGCAKSNKDPERYCTSVLRKRADNGKLVDTDNSTNDFTRKAAPTLK